MKRISALSVLVLFGGCAPASVSSDSSSDPGDSSATSAAATDAESAAGDGGISDLGASDAADVSESTDGSSIGTDASPGTDGAVATLAPCQRPKPGPTTTGVPAGVTLKKSGSITVSTKGALVEGLDISGSITVLADDVTIRNVRITTGDYYPIRYFDNNNTGLLVEDSEVNATSGQVTAAISFGNYTARRLNVHGSGDGFKANENVLIEDCWIHDLSNGPGEHNDGVQSNGGKGITLRHNVIAGATNAAVQAGNDNGVPTQDLTVECSWVDGGNYTLSINGPSNQRPTGTKILNNRFGRSANFGPLSIDDLAPVITGNVYDDNNAPLK